MAGKLTIIVIAHRLSAIRGADHIIVLDKGRIIEQGSPGELLRAKGHFARLLQRLIQPLGRRRDETNIT